MEAAALAALRLPILEIMEQAVVILFFHLLPQQAAVLDRPREAPGLPVDRAAAGLVMAVLDNLEALGLLGRVMLEERGQRVQIPNMAQVAAVEKVR